MNSWDILFILIMVLEIGIEAYQIGKKQGNLFINLIQIVIYLGTFLVYILNRGQGTFPFGAFLRVTMFAFILAIILEVSNFSIKDAENKLVELLISGLKFLPLIILVLYLTERFM